MVQTVMAAHRFAAPLLSRGCGTSLGGQCCNVAVVLDFSKYMHNMLHIDPEKKLGIVQPGCVLDNLRHAAEGYGADLWPGSIDPQPLHFRRHAGQRLLRRPLVDVR